MQNKSQSLFREHKWHDVLNQRRSMVQRLCDKLSKKEIDEDTVERAAARIAASLALVPPTIQRQGIEVSKREVYINSGSNDRRFDMADGDRRYGRSDSGQVLGTEVTVRVPFVGEPEMFHIEPPQHSGPRPTGSVRAGVVEFAIRGETLTGEDVKRRIDENVLGLESFLEFQRQSVGSFPAELLQMARQAVERRREKLNADDGLLSGLGYKVRD